MQAGLRAPECSGTQLQAMQTAGALVGGVRYGVDARRSRVLLWQALPRGVASGVRSEGALRPLRQRVDSPVEPPAQGGA